MNSSDILYTPLDLPPMQLDLDKIRRFRKDNKGEDTFGDRFFRTVWLRGAADAPSRSVYRTYDDSLDWQWNDIARQNFPEVILGVEALPFKLITMVTFVGCKNDQPMPPHHDYPPHQTPEFVLENEPYSYRVSIGDTRDAFYVSTHQGVNDHELDHGRYMFGNLPDDTNHWCMSVTNSLHATLPRNSKETLFISGILDTEAHNHLVRRSAEKYQDWMITRHRLEMHGRPLRELISEPWSDLKDRHPELYDVANR